MAGTHTHTHTPPMQEQQERLLTECQTKLAMAEKDNKELQQVSLVNVDVHRLAYKKILSSNILQAWQHSLTPPSLCDLDA